MSGTEPGEQDPASSGRGAVYLSQAYYYVVAAVGLLFLLGGAIAALIALRKWVLPISEAAESGSFGTSVDRNDAARSFLGALAFAIPGALLFAWHLPEARRREGRPGSRASWGGVLYFHLVALVSLMIALGGVVAALHALRDSVVPSCYELPGIDPPLTEGPTLEGEQSPIVEIDIPADSPLLESEECRPSTPEALRSALDAGIVTTVAGAAWVWHLRRGRRALDGPPPGS